MMVSDPTKLLPCTMQSDQIADPPVCLALAQVRQPLGDVSALEELSMDYGISSLEEIEGAQIRRALRLTGGNRTEAARMLGIDRRTLYRKIAPSAPGS